MPGDRMTTKHAKDRITELAMATGVHGVRFTHAGSLDEARRHLDKAIEMGYIPPESEPGRKTLNRLVNPAARLRTARSVVTAYLGYHTGEEAPDDPGAGVMAPYARANYYEELEIRLRHVACAMEDELGAAYRTSSNYVSLAEKPLAARSGLGFYGKHGIIITPRHGSYVVLGEIVTDLELEPDLPLDTSCGECTACMKACPTGAIREPGFVDRKVCLQYIGERPGTVPNEIREVWDNRLYGCSTCQDVCPFNRDIPADAPQATCGYVGSSLPLGEIVGIPEQAYTKRFLNNQAGMRERNAVRRNAIIAAGHSGLEELVGPLHACLADSDPMIRAHAVWAVARIRGADARPTLEEILIREWEPNVLSEARRALDALP
jgi:epoxyqueuosine reductase